MTETTMARASHRTDQRRSVRALLERTDEAMRKGSRAGATVWATGFDLLDSTLGGGLRSGELVLLGGSEGSGKTTLAIQVAREAVARGGTAVVFSYEHESHTLLERLLALEAAYAADSDEPGTAQPADVHAVRAVFEHDDPDRKGLADSLGRLPYGLPALAAVEAYADRLHIHESDSRTTVDQIGAVVAGLADGDGRAPVLVIDYLQKIPLAGHAGDEESRVTIVTETLKDLALEIGCPVVAVAASERDSLGAGHRMRTRDLRGSSALAYEADVVLILSSKEHVVAREHLVYDLSSLKRFRQWSVVSVEKNRHGLGDVELELRKDFAHGRFHPAAQVVSERLIEERVFTA